MEPVPLKRVADLSGFPLPRLSKLAIAGYFPSRAAGGRRRNVEGPVAEALVVMLRAGFSDGPMIQAVLNDPVGVAAVARRTAELLSDVAGVALAS